MMEGNAVGLHIPPRNMLEKPPGRNISTQIKSIYLSIFVHLLEK